MVVKRSKIGYQKVVLNIGFELSKVGFDRYHVWGEGKKKGRRKKRKHNDSFILQNNQLCLYHTKLPFLALNTHFWCQKRRFSSIKYLYQGEKQHIL